MFLFLPVIGWLMLTLCQLLSLFTNASSRATMSEIFQNIHFETEMDYMTCKATS